MYISIINSCALLYSLGLFSFEFVTLRKGKLFIVFFYDIRFSNCSLKIMCLKFSIFDAMQFWFDADKRKIVCFIQPRKNKQCLHFCSSLHSHSSISSIFFILIFRRQTELRAWWRHYWDWCLSTVLKEVLYPLLVVRDPKISIRLCHQRFSGRINW